jgi:heme exporter protein C
MKNWLKYLAVALLVYVHTAGLLFEVPRLNILNETIRVLYFHVPMWWDDIPVHYVILPRYSIFEESISGD